MSKSSDRGRGKQQRRGAHKRASKQPGRTDNRPQYGLRFTEKGRDALAEIFDQFRDKPLYYVLDEHGEAVPLGQNHLLTTEERARWHACYDDPRARTLAETVIPNPDAPAYPVVVHTAFEARDISFAYPLPNGVPVLWRTGFLDEPMDVREAAAAAAEEEEEDDGSWLVEPPPETPPEVEALARKLGLSDGDAFDEWSRVYSTREEAVRGHEETVRWVRRALGVF
jgi:hypothetical protein